MPLTKKGQKIMRAMKNEYGPKRGEQVFYASKNKGAIKGVERMAQGGSVAGKKFPDLTGDGKVTKKDILKGRGVAGFKDGKSVRVPMEPTEDVLKIIEAEQAEKGVSKTDVDISDRGAGQVKRRGDDKAVKTYRDGGMVRGCKGVQVSGKGFKGTY
jgi:hypothetical protein